MPRWIVALLLSLGAASGASAVTMAWTYIGDPGNPADTEIMGDGTTGYGSIPYGYGIGTYEVTNAQYVEFLNAKAAFDPFRLYNTQMGNASPGIAGGISRTGSSGSYSYSVIPGHENMPVSWVSFYDALRFTNWMNNGQGNADTETGAYTLLGNAEWPTNGNTITRNAGATIVLPSENEWYKAAYYSASSSSYFNFAIGTDLFPFCDVPSPNPRVANCLGKVKGPTPVGSYPGAPSPYGTFDQVGNVTELTETLWTSGHDRVARGGGWSSNPLVDRSLVRGVVTPIGEYPETGFRLVTLVPEPSTGLLVSAGLLALAAQRRA